MKYSVAACGGTFDRLHIGHKAFLSFAFERSEKVIIGLTSDFYIQEKKENLGVAPFAKRKKDLEVFLETQNFSNKAEIIAIDSFFGPTLDSQSPIQALIVTTDTFSQAEKINIKRRALNLPALTLLCAPVVQYQGSKISSSAIRLGQYSQDGEKLLDASWLQTHFLLPQSIRSDLQKPFGKLLQKDLSEIRSIPKEYMVAVGDVTVTLLNSIGKMPKISVVDFVVERKKTFATFGDLGFLGDEKIFKTTNPAGEITAQSLQKLTEVCAYVWDKKQIILEVSGEEDLLVLPLVLLLPEGFHVLYGQPQQGMVHIVVTAKEKQKISRILGKFNRV